MVASSPWSLRLSPPRAHPMSCAWVRRRARGREHDDGSASAGSMRNQSKTEPPMGRVLLPEAERRLADVSNARAE